jgi:undecaprenyl-diphosphatase
VLKGVGVIQDGLPDGVVGPMIIGIVAAAISGYAAIAWLLRFVRTRTYDIFVIYRLLAAGIVVLLILTAVRSADF